MNAYVVLSISDLEDMIAQIKSGRMNPTHPKCTTKVFETDVKPDENGNMQISSIGFTCGIVDNQLTMEVK